MSDYLSEEARDVRDRLKRDLNTLFMDNSTSSDGVTYSIQVPPERALDLAISAGFAALGALAEIERILRRLEESGLGRSE